MIEDRPRSDEFARLETLRLFGVLDTPAEALLDRITELAAHLFDVPIALVTLIDDVRQQIKSAYGLEPGDLPRESAFCDQTIRGDDVLIVPDAELDPRFRTYDAVVSDPHVRFYAGAPLIAPNGVKLGAMCIIDRKPRTLNATQIEMLERLSALVMEHLTLHRENRDAVAARNQLDAIIQASPFAIMTSLFDGRVTTWNGAAERIFGWTSAEALGGRSPTIPEELAGESATTRARIARGEFVRGLRTYRRHKNGAIIDVELDGAPVRDQNGTIVSGVYIVQDVTDVVRERAVDRDRFEILELAANDAPLQSLLDRLVANVELAVPGTIGTIVRVICGRLSHAASGAAMSVDYMNAIDGVPIGPTVGSCGAAAYLNETVVAADVATHPNWEPYRAAALAADLRACWSVPIRIASGVIGTLALYAREPRTPRDNDLRALHAAAHVASIVLEGYDARVKLQESAMRDALTGLPNRTLFEERMRDAIADAKRRGKRVAIGLLDLDRFKIVNDNLGHSVGDSLLQEVASRLQRSLRPNDTVARMGGDEFLMLIADVDDRENARDIACRSLASLEPSFAPGGHELFVRASLGLSLYPDDALEPSQLLRLADHAMYEAKSSGSTIAAYDGARATDGLTQLALETYLNHALENEEFELAYQPIVGLQDDALFGAEALLRWNHPRLGTLGPERFIAIAEDTGLIISIGAWVLREACRFSKRWMLAGGCGRVTVNVSPRQFEDRAFVETVVDALRRSGIPPGNLYLEITEGLIMRSPETVSATLAELRGLGIRSVIDDFGSGYSSLSYLKRFPIAALKVDRSFVSEIGVPDAAASDAAIVRAIVGVGKALGLGVIAEGVETEAQATFLRDAGCTHAQGFFFGRAMQSDQLIAQTGT